MIRIGISGWNYKGWRGDFYPPGLAQKRELAYAASRFPTIEINGTFYSLKSPASYARWVEETPEGFVFALKGSRYITHMLKGRNAGQALANFFASGLLRLGSKLGPMLWQFPPQFAFKPESFQAFLASLPSDTHAAHRLAARHDERMRGRSWIGEELMHERPRPVRHAIEIRHRSFVCPEFITLLRAYNVALVCADTVEWPLLMDVSADFAYVRLHGSEVLYTSGYSEEQLQKWVERAVRWASGGEVGEGEHASPTPAPPLAERDVYVYFDNDAKVWAPKDALSLEALVAEKRNSRSF